MSAFIQAISYYLPQEILTNDNLCEIFPVLTKEEIFAKTGIRKRHISATGETASDLAFKAAKKLFRENKINPASIDYIILCTETPDYIAPASSCILQHRLGLPETDGAIDITQGCSGFVYSLSVAKGLVESGQAKNVLLLTAETETKVIHPDDTECRMIFGDGAAATLISSSAKKGIGNFIFGTDGKGAKHLLIESSGFRNPVNERWLKKNKSAGGMINGKMHMNGTEIFVFALKVVPALVQNILEKNNLKMNDIDFFVFHQPNVFLLETLRRKIKIPQEKFIVELENFGNTVSSTIPIALCEAIKSGKIKRGMKILVAGFGIGYSWAGTVIQY